MDIHLYALAQLIHPQTPRFPEIVPSPVPGVRLHPGLELLHNNGQGDRLNKQGEA
jgi:hypothetical protein